MTLILCGRCVLLHITLFFRYLHQNRFAKLFPVDYFDCHLFPHHAMDTQFNESCKIGITKKNFHNSISLMFDFLIRFDVKFNRKNILLSSVIRLKDYVRRNVSYSRQNFDRRKNKCFTLIQSFITTRSYCWQVKKKVLEFIQSLCSKLFKKKLYFSSIVFVSCYIENDSSRSFCCIASTL